MKIVLLTLTTALLSTAACNKPDAGASAASLASATGSASPSSPAAPTPAAKAAFVQKGLQPGKVVVGYMQDASDPSQCLLATDVPAKKDAFAKDADKLAKMMKTTVVPSCPTDNVVGTCDPGAFSLLVNYSGPKWTADTAKKDCMAHHYKWIE